MPYKDPEKQKAAKRESYNRIYDNDPDFREREAVRKAEWLQRRKKAKPRASPASAPKTEKAARPRARSSRKRTSGGRSK